MGDHVGILSVVLFFLLSCVNLSTGLVVMPYTTYFGLLHLVTIHLHETRCHPIYHLLYHLLGSNTLGDHSFSMNNQAPGPSEVV